MTVIAILVFCCFIGSLTALLIQVFLETRRTNKCRYMVFDASARIHDVTDLTMRRMLEEALRSMGNQRLQGPMR